MYLEQTLDFPAPFSLLLKLLNHCIRVKVVLVNEKVIWAFEPPRSETSSAKFHLLLSCYFRF